MLAFPTSVNAAITEAPLYLQRINNKDYGKYESDIFIMHVHVGNPASAFNLTLDLTYYESMLIGAGSTSDMCSTSAHKGFNMSRSTTFRHSKLSPYTAQLEVFMVGRQCNVVLDATLTVGQDDFLGATQVPFGVFSRFQGAWDPLWASDGLLGLLGPDEEFSGQPGTAKALALKNGNPVVAWYLNGKRVVSEEAGKIAFGGLPEACSGLKYATPYYIDKRETWNFRVNGAALGGVRTDNVGGKGVFDYSTSVLLRLPKVVFDNFAAEIKAEEYLGTGIYYVNCDGAIKLPSLNITLEGLDKPLVFPHHAYIDLVPNQRNGKCEVRLRPWDSGNRFWTFGNRLWENYCVALNYDTGYVGFSRFSADI